MPDSKYEQMVAFSSSIFHLHLDSSRYSISALSFSLMLAILWIIIISNYTMDMLTGHLQL